ncbi:NifB/NifX family molybdenum-iron cluster-binding protein [Geomesophilobacter sediminis]|uniref:Uncharacterized protein n=1 Tax=Geomesophilobacter sediminis TaxID=2798584 RepID=A0A8J7LTT7_9BACT|nr:NifB/NifX family molybdenum-iron cluster-binding protein [Geomesophilobacter sediminis]MBJ6723794.1 hypothetical protein [Geomesophilobacter sediminis]
MKVAFASSDGIGIDGGFLKTGTYDIWEIRSDASFYLHRLEMPGGQGSYDLRNAVRIEALNGCAMVCATEISIRSRARLVAHKIHALEAAAGTEIQTMVGRLQDAFCMNSAPWLHRVQMRDTFDARGQDQFRLEAALSRLLGTGWENRLIGTLKQDLERRGISPELFLSLPFPEQLVMVHNLL